MCLYLINILTSDRKAYVRAGTASFFINTASSRHYMLGCSVNNKLERMSKEEFVALFEGLWNITKHHITNGCLRA